MGSAGEKVLIDKADALAGGHYAAKQIFSRDRLVAWSHRRRFETALALAAPFRGQRMLDYGCGDGTFLALLWDREMRPDSAVGAELDGAQVDDCRARLGHLPGVAFESIARLDGEQYAGAFDVVVCMEVLEHVVAVDAVIDRLWRLLSASGTLIVSVPVETGVPLIVKQAVRRVAGWRGIGDYAMNARYTFGEYLASLFAGAAPHMRRPIYNADGDVPFHDHKGFNWRVLRARVERRFTIDRIVSSPIAWLGPAFATQVWFVARRKPL
jgi:SAM-dependent methyltransferase